MEEEEKAHTKTAPVYAVKNQSYTDLSFCVLEVTSENLKKSKVLLF